MEIERVSFCFYLHKVSIDISRNCQMHATHMSHSHLQHKPNSMSKAAPVTGLVYDPEKPRIDRVASTQGRFDDFYIEANVAETVILLLHTREENMLAVALHHLDQFAQALVPSRYAELHDRGILVALMPLREHAHLNVRRFAMKMLSQMFLVPDAAVQLAEKEEFILTALRMFEEETDDFLVEYASISLNRLTENAQCLPLLVENGLLMASIFKRIADTRDPDVLLQSLVLLARLCDERDGLDSLCARSNFPFDAVVKAIDHQFKRVQTAALRVLNKSAECSNVVHVRKFENASFMDKLFEVLENEERESLHAPTLQLLRQVLKRPTIADAFCKDVSLERFCDGFVKDTVNHKLSAMGILAELAQYADARPALHDHNFSEDLMTYLSKGIVTNIALGISRMAAHKPALDAFMNANVVPILCAILAGEPLPAPPGATGKAKPAAAPKKGKEVAVDTVKQLADRKETALCLSELFRLSDDACQRGIECGIQNTIAGFLMQPGSDESVPIELRLPLVQMLNSLARLTAQRHKVMTYTVAESLYRTLEVSRSCPMFMVEVLHCMTLYMQQEQLRYRLLKSGCAKFFIDVLSNERTAIVVRKAIVDAIVATQKDPDLTDMFIDSGLLDW